MPWMLAWPGGAPVYVVRAEGANVSDVDGNEYVDFCLGDTAAMTGHSPPATVREVAARLEHGLTLMLPTEDALEVSRELAARFGLPRWQFTLSATDANRHALRYARHVTGRSKILVFDRSYHGTVDECFATCEGDEVVARPGSLGPPVPPALTTRVVQFNDEEALIRELSTADVACVLTEPALTNIGIVLPDSGFHAALRDWTEKTGTLLVIDETHTISVGPGGYTASHQLRPDMLVIGKPIGGGVPAAALGMSEQVAESLEGDFDPDRAGMRGVGGTMAGNALSLAAMRATLRNVLTHDAYAAMTALGERLAAGIRHVIDAHGLPWHVVQLGGRVEFHFCPTPLRNGAEGARIVNRALSQYLQLFALNRGVMMFPFHNRALVCPAHSRQDVDRFLAVLDEAVNSLGGALV
jgi:glutamate-1-semialdehyde aminotransferase